jgi:hypothetical protein
VIHAAPEFHLVLGNGGGVRGFEDRYKLFHHPTPALLERARQEALVVNPDAGADSLLWAASVVSTAIETGVWQSELNFPLMSRTFEALTGVRLPPRGLRERVFEGVPFALKPPA